MFIAKDDSGKRVCIEDAIKDENYYCPICGGELIQKKGEINVFHFAHKLLSEECDNWSNDMSFWHNEWQNLFPMENREVIVNFQNIKHIADVLINDTVIEFQHSPISSGEFWKRNNFYKKAGKKVVWVFDMQNEFDDGRIDYLNDDTSYKFKWKYPVKFLDNYNPKKDKDITIYFDVNENEEDGAGEIIRIAWVSPQGFRRFCADEWYSTKEFIKLFIKDDNNKEIKKIKNEEEQLKEFLPQIRKKDSNNYYYGCQLKSGHYSPFEDCLGCKYLEERKEYGIICSYKHKHLRLNDSDRILSVKKHDGLIYEVKILSNGSEKTYNFPKVPSVLKSLSELWNEYNCNVFRAINYITGIEVQISRNPSEMIALYGHCYGKMKYNYEDYTKQQKKIFRAQNREWYITWFAKD